MGKIMKTIIIIIIILIILGFIFLRGDDNSAPAVTEPTEEVAGASTAATDEAPATGETEMTADGEQGS